MDLVKKGASVFFFPEGTRSMDGKLGLFKVRSKLNFYLSECVVNFSYLLKFHIRVERCI